MDYKEEQYDDYLNSLEHRQPELIKCDFCFDGFEADELHEVRTEVWRGSKSTTFVEQSCKGCLREMKKWEQENKQ